jgi:hypothetical protein
MNDAQIFPTYPSSRKYIRPWIPGVVRHICPAGTPQSTVATMSYAMNNVPGDPDLRQTLSAIAMAPNPGTSEALATLLRDDYEKNRSVYPPVQYKRAVASTAIAWGLSLPEQNEHHSRNGCV